MRNALSSVRYNLIVMRILEKILLHKIDPIAKMSSFETFASAQPFWIGYDYHLILFPGGFKDSIGMVCLASP